jgi:hypothetical protein
VSGESGYDNVDKHGMEHGVEGDVKLRMDFPRGPVNVMYFKQSK